MLLLLTYQRPFDWAGILSFLQARATPGVEVVESGVYRRTIAIDGATGDMAVSPHPTEDRLVLDVQLSAPRPVRPIADRVRRIFDVAGDPTAVSAHLARSALLRGAIASHPGVRVPGAWDEFELSVRAILGQQVSVKAATTIAGRVAALFGDPVSARLPLCRLFPTARQLVDAPIEKAGVMKGRAESIRQLAQRVHSGAIVLTGHPDRVVQSLKSVPGIGDWTAQYVAMRALNDRDAFPSGDLILRRAAGNCTAGELERTSQAWRPWRAYAVMLLWRVNAGK